MAGSNIPKIWPTGAHSRFWFSPLSRHAWPRRVFSSDEQRASFGRAASDRSGRGIASPAFLARLGAAGRRKLKERSPYD